MNNNIKTTNIVSSTEVINIIETSVKTLISAPSMAHTLPSILLTGAPGVGKSAVVKEIANKLGIGFVDVRLAQLERVDVCGLPSVENNSTKWNVPSFWPRDPESAGIIFFDEITSAPSDVQVAAYSLVLDRRIPNSDYELPPRWYVIAAGNRKQDHAVAKTMSSALANRFMHFDIEANVEDWNAWAVKHDIHPSVTGYVQYRPGNLFNMENQDLEHGWPSPRSWERVSTIISMFGNNEDVLRKTVYGLIGPAVGTEFMEFHRINSSFDDTLKMMTDPDAEIIIPKDADRRYALCAAVSYLLWNGKNADDENARISGMYRIAMKFDSAFATLLVKNALNGNSKVDALDAAVKLSSNDGYKKFAEKYGHAFAKKGCLAA